MFGDVTVTSCTNTADDGLGDSGGVRGQRKLMSCCCCGARLRLVWDVDRFDDVLRIDAGTGLRRVASYFFSYARLDGT